MRLARNVHRIQGMSKRTMKQGDATLAVAYIRASKDEQRLSPEAQRAQIEAWALRTGVTVAAWHVDHVCSVTDIEGRDGLMAALADLRTHGAGILVVAKRDRIARDVVVAATIEREAAARGARIASAAGEGTEGNDPSSQLMRGISDLFAQHERAMIRSRTRAALAAKSAKGERVGTVPYGSTLAADGTHLEPNAAEQRTIEEARALRSQGLSLRAVAAELAVRGHLSRAGTAFTPSAVNSMTADCERLAA